MNRYLNVLILIWFTGCASKYVSHPQDNKFMEYVNQNKIGMNLDDVLVKDKPFRLKIPIGLQNRYSEVGYSFLQVLNFKNDQKIVLIYIPNKSSPILKSTDISYKKFVDLCKKEDIAWILEKIPVSKHRHFGLYKPNADKFYSIYLNVQDKEVSDFTYSISSVQLHPPG